MVRVDLDLGPQGGQCREGSTLSPQLPFPPHQTVSSESKRGALVGRRSSRERQRGRTQAPGPITGQFPSRLAAGPGECAEFPQNDQVEDRKVTRAQLRLLWLLLWPGRQRIAKGCNRLVRPCPALPSACLWPLWGWELKGSSWHPLSTEPQEVPGEKATSVLETLLETVPTSLSLCPRSRA